MKVNDIFLITTPVSLVDDDTIPATIKERRKCAPVDGNGILKEDMLFTSPSYAAMFVIGKSANGLTSWKTADGQTSRPWKTRTLER